MLKELFDTAKAKVAEGRTLARTIEGRIKGAKALHKAIKDGGTDSYKRVGEILKKMAEAPKTENNKELFLRVMVEEAKAGKLTLAQLGRVLTSFTKHYAF